MLAEHVNWFFLQLNIMRNRIWRSLQMFAINFLPPRGRARASAIYHARDEQRRTIMEWWKDIWLAFHFCIPRHFPLITYYADKRFISLSLLAATFPFELWWMVPSVYSCPMENSAFESSLWFPAWDPEWRRRWTISSHSVELSTPPPHYSSSTAIPKASYTPPRSVALCFFQSSSRSAKQWETLCNRIKHVYIMLG